MWKKILLMLILLSSIASAATIHGTVYDFSLNIAENVMVELDTTPKQLIVAKDGKYSFDVALGDYNIKAELLKDGQVFSNAEEEISVIDDGNYVLDLILFENLDDETALLEEDMDFDPTEIEEEVNPIWWLILIPVILFCLVVTYLAIRYFRSINYNHDTDENSDSIDQDLEKLLKIIKDEGGRTTQKNIRKRLGLSEAKVSLMISDLEDRGIVKRIKKGRGNIIIIS